MFVALDGQPVQAVTGGFAFDPALPCLVFIHGAQHDHFVWMQQVRHFAGRGYSILAVDLPGHGQSGGAPLPSIEALADWLLALLAKVGAGGMKCPEWGTAPAGSAALMGTAHFTPNITLIGHSMGSLIALEAAARAPSLIRHLVLIGTAVPMPVAPALLETAQKNEPAAMALINQWAHSPRGLRGVWGSLGQWLPGINLRIMERQKPGVLYTDLAACNAYQNGPAAIARLSCPVTLIAGKSDRMTSVKASRRLAEQMSQARHVELPAVGHAMMAEAPLAVNQAIAEALVPTPST
jgi:pimeloyl-ACP methyl ester carboxylesterase